MLPTGPIGCWDSWPVLWLVGSTRNPRVLCLQFEGIWQHDSCCWGMWAASGETGLWTNDKSHQDDDVFMDAVLWRFVYVERAGVVNISVLSQWQSHVCLRMDVSQDNGDKKWQKRPDNIPLGHSMELASMGSNKLPVLKVLMNMIRCWSCNPTTSTDILVSVLSIHKDPEVPQDSFHIFFRRNKGPFFLFSLVRGQNIWRPRNAQRKPIWSVAFLQYELRRYPHNYWIVKWLVVLNCSLASTIVHWFYCFFIIKLIVGKRKVKQLLQS